MEFLVSNLGGKVRREVLDGRTYLVAPATLLKEGVLNGSRGPLFYPRDEFTKNYNAWDGMPIVINHPTDDDGLPVSARRPDIHNKYSIGKVFNTKPEDDRMRAELWFDEEKTKTVDPRILSALNAGKKIELSTGLFTKMDPSQKGDFNGKEYIGIARNYQPDHLAILPDNPGACSLNDGCGVFNGDGGGEGEGKEGGAKGKKGCTCVNPKACECKKKKSSEEDQGEEATKNSAILWTPSKKLVPKKIIFNAGANRRWEKPKQTKTMLPK